MRESQEKIEERIRLITENGGDIKLNIDDNHTLKSEEYGGVKKSYWFLCNQCKKEWFYKSLDAYWNGKTFRCKECISKNNRDKNKINYDDAINKVLQLESEIYTLDGCSINYETWGRVIDKYIFKCTGCNEYFEKEYRRFIESPLCNKCLGIERWDCERISEYVQSIGSEVEFLGELNKNTKHLFKCISKGCNNKIKRTWNKFYNREQRLCRKCSIEQLKENKRKTKEQYLSELKENNINIILLGEYETTNTPTRHKCPRCGNEDWFPTPSNILSGKSVGCNICMISKGEDKIQNFLISKNVNFKKEKTFEGLLSPRGYNLRFDFFLPNKNTCIEYDGKQHYEVVKGFNTEESLIYSQQNDNIKNNYCRDNNINLIRIPYYDFENIESILTRELSV